MSKSSKKKSPRTNDAKSVQPAKTRDVAGDTSDGIHTNMNNRTSKEVGDMKKNVRKNATSNSSANTVSGEVFMKMPSSDAVALDAVPETEQFVWLDNAILQVNPEIQRKLNPMRVLKIQREFSPMVANPIKVSFRDGKYYIFDGMHTRAAIRRINGKDNFPILCRVFHGLTEQDEAKLFAAQFGYAEKVPLAYRLRALNVAEDPDVLDFLDTTRKCGFDITLGSHIAHHGGIAATCNAFKAFEDLGREKYSRMLMLLHRTWAGENWSVSRYMLRGMARFMKMYDFQDAAFVKAFRGVTRKEVIHEAERFPGMTWDGAVATALGEIFDRNSSSMLYRIR